jgi:transcriptional regulator with XRE-family HTH domain
VAEPPTDDSDQPLTLAELRQRLGVTQEQLGRALGVIQQQVWKWERAPDLRLSTLANYVLGLGASLGRPSRVRVIAEIDSSQFEITAMSNRRGRGQPVPPNDHRSAFRMRAWSDPKVEHAFLTQGVIAMGDDDKELHGKQIEHPSDQQIRDRLLRDHPDKRGPEGRQTIGIWTAYWRAFFNDMKEGDIVVFAPKGSWVAIGEVAGPYEYAEDEPNGKLRHRRRVRWLATHLARRTLDADLLRVVNAPGTICSINAPRAAERLRALAGAEST